MADFDSFLNLVIPWIILVVGIYLLYRPLKEPLKPLFAGIGNFCGSMKRKITGEDNDRLYEDINTLEYE